MFNLISNKSLARRVKDHVTGKEHNFFAVVQPGFESAAAGEFRKLGFQVSDEKIEGGIEFTGRVNECYRACIMARSAVRIVMRLGIFRSGSFGIFEKEISEYPWELFISPLTSLKFRSSAKKSMIYHTGKLEEIFSEKIKKRLEHYSDSYNGIPESAAGVQEIILRNDNDRCYVSLDASGSFLYKRGNRSLISAGSLRESTAALILMEAGIEQYEKIIDPMCGSGTFSLEAAGILTGSPAVLERNFPFESWPCFKENNYSYIKRKCSDGVLSSDKVPTGIITSDIDDRAVRAAELNGGSLFPDLIRPEKRDFFSFEKPCSRKKTLLVLNPPYGKRVKSQDIGELYRNIGNKIRKDFQDCGFAVIAPGHEAEKNLALRYDRKILFMNGGIRSAVLFKDLQALPSLISLAKCSNDLL